jgi:hypothetical protein
VSSLRPGLRISNALRRTADVGHAHVADAIEATSLRALAKEIREGPLQPFEGSYGKVRMQIEGFDVTDPMEGFDAVRRLRDEVAALVRAQGRGIRGLATWWPNEAGAVLYRPGSYGISPHLDGKWYRRLVVVATIHGRASFSVHPSRDAAASDGWVASAGGLAFIRGLGLAGHRDGRPYHAVPGPRRGIRISLALRMAVGGG